MQKKTIISFLVSLVLLAAVLYFADINQLFGKILSFGFIPFLAANLLFTLTYLIHGLKWQLIISHFKKVSAKDSILILIIGYFVMLRDSGYVPTLNSVF